MHIKKNSIHVLLQSFRKSKLLSIKIPVNLITGYILWPLLTLLNESLPINTKLMKVEDPSSDKEPTIHRDYFASAMNWLSHLTH